MSRIITVASQKGGVGKTTIALNLAYNLSRIGNSVLIIDGDPQGGIALATNLRKRTETGLIDVVRGERDPSSIVMATRATNLSVAGIGTLSPEDIFLLERESGSGKLASLIKEISGGYDYTIIDAPAGVGSIVAALLISSHGVLLVNTCRMLSLKTVSAILKTIAWARKNGNPGLVLEGVAISMLNLENKVEAGLFEDIKKTFPPEALFKTSIPYDESIEVATTRALPVALIGDESPAARACLNLALELKEREIKRAGKESADADAFGLF